ncbi:hypothetical protein [Streptomyces sp. NPDC047315]|uniref:hypothetical protein n=1 Tax=Streptomyces sp. NPDC047315 TaxID=3155142 RepID=UPI0033F97D46
MSTHDKTAHGPDNGTFGKYVTLTAEATVNGEQIKVQQQVARALWQRILEDSSFFEDYKRILLDHLAVAVASHLEPTITVEQSPAAVSDAVSAVLARADTGMRNEPDSERRPSFELESEA